MGSEETDAKPAATEQLVMEVLVRDLDRSLGFYEELGFERIEVEGNFAILAWKGSQLFLFEPPDVDLLDPPYPAPCERTGMDRANLRIMVSDVDAIWECVQEMDVTVIMPIDDRSYGVRDFAIADPDGFGLRFATRLA